MKSIIRLDNKVQILQFLVYVFSFHVIIRGKIVLYRRKPGTICLSPLYYPQGVYATEEGGVEKGFFSSYKKVAEKSSNHMSKIPTGNLDYRH